MIGHVAIVGAGFSGALQAINLLRHDGPRATLIERSQQIARGVAYSAAHPSHLLNVRAGNMSALPDDPAHFVRWLERQGLGGGTSFVPRIAYGAYLGELLDETRAMAPGRLQVVQGDAVDLTIGATGGSVRLADGTAITADAIVLALGNLPPHEPGGLDPAALGPDRYAANPWAADLAEGLTDQDEVLVIGTGLTTVDVALLLDAKGFGGRIFALSRRGLEPRAHMPGHPVSTALAERPSIATSALVREVRGRAAQVGWRAAVDELRPYTRGMWLAAPPHERARFLRHLRPWWDIHRHRLAPAVADRIAALKAEGRLIFAGGKTSGFAADGDGVAVTWRPRGAETERTMRVRRVVNCSGPQIDLARTPEPLLRALCDRGAIRPDPNEIGLDVDAQGRLIAADGSPHERLYALGPLTRGAFWEIVAVPDIRVQTWDLARRLSNAQWVGGEGL